MKSAAIFAKFQALFRGLRTHCARLSASSGGQAVVLVRSYTILFNFLSQRPAMELELLHAEPNRLLEL
jgi:hypothetical protein